MKKPTFTIVTPSFNQGDFIEETIKSIWDQEGNFTIQHIIADAGSKDDSVKIIKKYARALEQGKYSINCKGITLTWWSKPDNGQSDALNQGFSLAQGEIVAWLNTDDVYLPGALQSAYKAMKAHPKAGLIYSDHLDIDSSSKELRRLELPDFDFDYVANGNIISQPASFMRKAALDRVGLLDPSYHYAMDYELWLRIARKFSVIHISEYWAGFRLHDESKTVALASRFYKEERKISRKNGGRFFSRLYLYRLHTRWPLLARVITKLVLIMSPTARSEARVQSGSA